MTDRWRRVVTLHFGGGRYGEHALDAAACGELQRFQTLVTDTAKALWRHKNPGRARLPKNFESRTQLWLRSIENGSTAIPFEMLTDKPLMSTIEEPQINNEATEAIDIVYRVFKAVNNDLALPEECPKQLLSEYAHLGESLSISCTLRFAPPKQDIAHVTKRDRDQLISIAETSYEDELDITGRVLEADVRKRQFQIWIDEKTSVVASFTREQEAQITSALKGHESVRLRVRGRGEFTPEGKPRKVYQVVSLDSISSDGTGFDTGAPQIEDVITNIFRDIPDGEWDQIPTDLSRRLDSYVSGRDEP